LCCAPTHESRNSWIRAILARTAPDPVVATRGGNVVVPESRLLASLRKIQSRQFAQQARNIQSKIRTYNTMRINHMAQQPTLGKKTGFLRSGGCERRGAA